MLKELTVPLRDIVNYEADISNVSDIYYKLARVQAQINTSLEDIQNMVSKACIQLSVLTSYVTTSLFAVFYNYRKTVISRHHVRIYLQKDKIKIQN